MHSITSQLVVFATLLSSMPAQGDLLYTVNVADGNLRVYDLMAGSTTQSMPIMNGAIPAIMCSGMARNSLTGVTYALVDFGPGRSLCTLDLSTGAATVIGLPGDYFSGLACRFDGVLHAVTGDGGNTPETLYTIDTNTAVATFVATLGSGGYGETIGFADPSVGASGLALYHVSGSGAPNVQEVFERIDTLGGNTITNVPLSGFDFDEFLSLTSYTGDSLIGCDLNDDILIITTSGHVSRFGTLDHSYVRGLVFEPSPNSQPFFRQYGTGCAAASGAIPTFFGSGVPMPGNTVGLHLRFAPPGAFGLLVYGLGNGALPLPTPTCRAQINPVLVTSGFFTTGPGVANFSMTLPSPFAPVDFYAQVGLIDGGNFIVGSPLQIHVQ